MTLKEYLDDNNVTLWRNRSYPYSPERTDSLPLFDIAKGLENVVGKMVWICDYRVNKDPKKKPIRNIPPMPVVVTDAKKTRKDIYCSPVYFRQVKNGKIYSNVIVPFDNTGYRMNPGTSVNIFYTVEDCIKCYREQVRQATETYQNELERMTTDFTTRIDILEKSLIPYADYRVTESTVTVKIHVLNDADKTFDFTYSSQMFPNKDEIKQLKKHSIETVLNNIRTDTWFKAKFESGSKVSGFMEVFVDGMYDANEKEIISETV